MTFFAFDRYVDDHADEFVTRLRDLCRIPSIAAEHGPAMKQAAEQVCNLAGEAGLTVERVSTSDGPDVVLAQGGAGTRGLMVYNHYDVQPPDPLNEWVSPPFGSEIRDGILYARGVADNKGHLVSRLCAIEAYRSTIGELPLRLACVFEGEEEVGSPHLAGFAHDHQALLRTLDGCVWEMGYKDEAGRAVISLGLKGVVSVLLSAQSLKHDAHSGNGGLYPNAAWRLVEALGTLRTPGGEVKVDGLLDHVQPPSVAELAALRTIPFESAAIRSSLGIESFLGGLDGEAALHRLMFEPTCTINGMWGGYTGPGSKTVIPARAYAKLDFRLVPGLTPELTVRLLREHLSRRGFADIEAVEEEEGLMPARTDPSAPVVGAALAALSEVMGTTPVIHPTSAGSGPMHQLCTAYGIPAVAFGIGWARSLVHAPNESIRIPDYIEGIKVFGRMLAFFSGSR